MAYHSVLSDGAFAVFVIYNLTWAVKRVAAKRKIYDAVINSYFALYYSQILLLDGTIHKLFLQMAIGLSSFCHKLVRNQEETRLISFQMQLENTAPTLPYHHRNNSSNSKHLEGVILLHAFTVPTIVQKFGFLEDIVTTL